MENTFTIVEKAYVFATVAHRDQKRKYTGQPYIVHPVAVASILIENGIADSNVVAAALLHDTIEDCEVTRYQIEIICNKQVADLVWEVTDQSTQYDSDGQKINRKRRKEIDRQHLAKSSYYGASIKLADLIHNTESIVQYDPDFAKVYISEKIRLLEVLKHGHPGLFSKATQKVAEYKYGAKFTTWDELNRALEERYGQAAG